MKVIELWFLLVVYKCVLCQINIVDTQTLLQNPCCTSFYFLTYLFSSYIEYIYIYIFLITGDSACCKYKIENPQKKIFTLKNLQPGYYEYTVTSYNSVGESIPSFKEVKIPKEICEFFSPWHSWDSPYPPPSLFLSPPSPKLFFSVWFCLYSKLFHTPKKLPERDKQRACLTGPGNFLLSHSAAHEIILKTQDQSTLKIIDSISQCWLWEE